MTLPHLPFTTEHSYHVWKAQAEQARAEAAHRALIEESEKIRRGEEIPSNRVLRHLARNAVRLAETSALSPFMISDTLTTTQANLHAVGVDDTPETEIITDLSEGLMERIHPNEETDPLDHLEAETKRWAIVHTTTKLPYSAAYEIGWDRIKAAYGWKNDADDNLIPPVGPSAGTSYPTTAALAPPIDDKSPVEKQ
ncbi:MAG TPA: hypothetical protein VK502_02170 [Candidatus Saccharimonadales bacterium]|nr:hypothetical protein [Candidatus Saccharimonadales bacterium]